jgi:4-amino-4-deoxy-L-arabinose transferase-like glycosyltransferase
VHRDTWSDRPIIGRATLFAAALLGLIALGAFVRFLGIDFGRPYAYHPDEGIVVGAAMNMVHDRDWNPHNFFYPSLMFDVQAVVTAVARQFGGGALDRGQGWLFDSEALPGQFRYFLAGRWVVAAMGVLTIPVTFAIGARWRVPGAGLIAAAIVATAALHVTNSRFMTTDVPVTLFCALTLLASVEGQRRSADRWWILAGVLAGLATATKWNGAAVLVVPIVAYLASATSFREIGGLLRRRTPYLIVVAAVAALLVTTPAILFDATAVRDFLVLQGELYTRGRGNERSLSAAYNVRVLFDGVGPLAAALGILGAVAIVIGRHRRELAIPVFVGVYFIAISIPATHYERNVLPMVPYLAIAAGLLVVRAAGWIAGHRPGGLPRPRRFDARILGVLVVGVLVLGLAPGYASGIAEGQRLQHPDTRTLAHDWIIKNIGHSQVIARERYTPQLTSERYRLRNHGFLWERGWAWYQEQGVRYLVASSTVYGQAVGNPNDPVHDRFYRELFSLPEVFRADPDDETPGPTIRIFELPPGVLPGP